MDVWAIDQWDGEPINADPTEHDALAWLNQYEMAALKLADPLTARAGQQRSQRPTTARASLISSRRCSGSVGDGSKLKCA